MEQVVSVILGIIAVWSFALGISTIRNIRTVIKQGFRNRSTDWWQLTGLMCFALIAGSSSWLWPSLVEIYTTSLLALELAAIVLLEYVTEQQYHTDKKLKGRSAIS